MKPTTPFQKAVAAALLFCLPLSALADGLISAEASEVVHAAPAKTPSARGRQLATLESYLLADSVTVGLDPKQESCWQANSIKRGIKIWSDALSDSPFTLAQPGQ